MPRSLIASILAALSLGVFAAPGAGAPAQAMSDSTAAWLSGVLRAPVGGRDVVVRATLESPQRASGTGRTVVGTYDPVKDQIAILRAVTSTYYSIMSPSTYPSVVIHENLHRREIALNCYSGLDEAITETLTLDLLPAWGWRFMRIRGLRASAAYPKGVSYIRWLAVHTVGGKPYKRNPAARRWVRTLWGASCAVRSTMTGGAHVAAE